jgi:hypothetical protein
VTLEERLEAARDAAAAHAGPGEEVPAVVAAAPGRDSVVYLAAIGPAGAEEYDYLGLDEALRPVTDLRLLRDAVAIAALAEHAEEVSGATAVEELDRLFAAAGGEQVRVALAELAEASRGPRVASPEYLDGLAMAAANLAAALGAFQLELEERSQAAGEAGAAALEPSWAALAAASRAGDPADFARVLATGTQAAEQLADVVVERHRVPLV